MKKGVVQSNQGYKIVAISTASPSPVATVEDNFEAESSSLTAAVLDEDAFRSSLKAVEHILNYRFGNKVLLEAALTHSSYPHSPSYQRLEFVGDACLGLALANFVFIAYPDLDPGQLSLIRSANISTEKLARVAIRHNLFSYVRHNAPHLEAKVNEFALAIQEEDEILPYGGSLKAPKVLADIVESVAAAIYVDCNFDLRILWEAFIHILEPIVTLENIQQQPVTMLYELCQKEGKNLDFKHWKKGDKNICSVFVDGKLLSSVSAEQKDISKLSAAKAALQKMPKSGRTSIEVPCDTGMLNGVAEIHEAKQKLIEHCHKNRWPKPTYRVENTEGPSHDRKFICSVQSKTSDGKLVVKGDLRSKVKDAENSAASAMLHVLNDAKDEAEIH